MPGPEFALVEKPAIDILTGLGYDHLPAGANETARDGLNQVLLRDPVIEAVRRLNGLDIETARRIYQDLLTVSDNERWIEILRGQYSRSRSGRGDAADHPPDRLPRSLEQPLHRHEPALREVGASAVRRPGGLRQRHPAGGDRGEEARRGQAPLGVRADPPVRGADPAALLLERASTWSPTGTRPASVPPARRGPTGGGGGIRGLGEQAEFADDFEKTLWALLEPSRLLDLLAHFIVFEREAGHRPGGEEDVPLPAVPGGQQDRGARPGTDRTRSAGAG